MMFRSLPLALLMLSPLVTPVTTKAEVILQAGVADLVFYYESQAASWHTVLRAGPSVTATGLGSPFAGFTGIVGNSPNDFPFGNHLTTNISTVRQVAEQGTDFYVATAAGSPFNPAQPTADLGIRTRLRENQVAMGTGANSAANQFESFSMTLNTGLSFFNGTQLEDTLANVALLHWNQQQNPVAVINSASGLHTASFGNFAHVHRNWGFSDFGQYDLKFDIRGIGGTYGSTAPAGSFSLRFNVVPEPAAFALVGLALGYVPFVRKRRNNMRFA